MSSIFGIALSSVGTIGNNLSVDKTRSQMLSLGAQDPKYTQSQYAQEGYGLAKNLLNARMPGAANIEKNIYQNQANTTDSIEKNATDGSQALAMLGASQGNTNKAFQNLGTAENQNYMNTLNNLEGQQKNMTEENDKSYQDSVRKWQDSMNILMQRGNMRSGEWQNVTNLGGMVSSMGLGSIGGSGGGGK